MDGGLLTLSSFLTRTALAAALPVLFCCPIALSQVNERGIADVAAGKLTVAEASWWGFDSLDATRCLQAAIDSGVPKLVVGNVGKPWVVEPIRLVSNQEIVFEEGVEVVARKGSFKGDADSLFTASVKENVTLRGYGAVLRMRRSDYAKPPYAKAEWRHVLTILSCRNVRVLGLTCRESGGDGIYLGVRGGDGPNRDVLIKDVVCDGNYRQGISVISAEDLLIENCTLSNTSGTNPMAGIDFEPNRPGERLVRCVVRNCVTEGNGGPGYAVYIPNLSAESAPVSLRFEGCRSRGDATHGTSVYTGNEVDAAVTGGVEFADCVFEESGHTGVLIRSKPVGGCRLRFDRCSVRDAAVERAEETPIAFTAGAGASRDVGGVEFVDCLVRDDVERHPLSFSDRSGFGLVRLVDINGRLTVEHRGTRREHVLSPKLLGEWVPPPPFKHVARKRVGGLALRPAAPHPAVVDFGMPEVRVRYRGEYVLFASAGQDVRLRAAFMQVGNYSADTMPLVVTAPSGEEVASAAAPFMKQADVAFRAPETGVYDVRATPWANCAGIVSSTHPLNLSGDARPMHFYHSPKELFFRVPAGTEEFALRVFGEGAEGVRATVFGPDGKVVQEQDNITELHQFLFTLPEPSAGETWSVRLVAPSEGVMEDNYLVILGIPPLVASHREALLTPAR